MRDPSAFRGHGLFKFGRGRKSSFNHLDRSLEDALFVDPIFRPEQRLGSVFDKAVGDTQTHHVDSQESLLLKELKNGTPEPSLENILLHSEDLLCSRRPVAEKLPVKGLQETRIDDGHVYAVIFESLCGMDRGINRGTNRQDKKIISFLQDFPFSNLKG